MKTRSDVNLPVPGLSLTASEQAEFLEAARLCGHWLINTQNIPGRPWGPVDNTESADGGRFLAKACPSRERLSPAGIWLTALYLCGLTELLKTPILDKPLYRKAVDFGGWYLKSLQCFDIRWPKAVGGFHENRPGDPYSAPRDAATGAFALVALYLDSGEPEYLDRAVRFAEWYSTHGSDSDGYPWDDYDLPAGKGVSRLRGDWQAGGALIYHRLWSLTGEPRWKKALKRVLDTLVEIASSGPTDDTAYTFHGDCILSVGNDDFANTVLLAGHDLFGKQEYLDLCARRLRDEIARQDERGAFPGYGGTYVTALELLEAADYGTARGVEVLPTEELIEPLLRAARFGLTQQEKSSPERWLHGGVYGQSNYAHARDVVNGRDTGYAMLLWLRLAGFPASTFAVQGWAQTPPKAKSRKKK